MKAYANLKNVLVIGLFLSFFSIQAAQPAGVDPALEAWWSFDQVQDNKIPDLSGHNRIAKPAQEWDLSKALVPGKVGKALEFPGNRYLIVPGYRGVTGMRARTIVAWIRTSRNRGTIVRWGKNDFGRMWSFGYIRGRIGVSPRGGYFYMKEPTHDGKWHMVAITLKEGNPPRFEDFATLYLDGEVAEIHDIGLLDLWPINTGADMEVRIGENFRGAIDELRIYSRVLSADEIQQLWKEAQKAKK